MKVSKVKMNEFEAFSKQFNWSRCFLTRFHGQDPLHVVVGPAVSGADVGRVRDLEVELAVWRNVVQARVEEGRILHQEFHRVWLYVDSC